MLAHKPSNDQTVRLALQSRRRQQPVPIRSGSRATSRVGLDLPHMLVSIRLRAVCRGRVVHERVGVSHLGRGQLMLGNGALQFARIVIVGVAEQLMVDRSNVRRLSTDAGQVHVLQMEDRRDQRHVVQPTGHVHRHHVAGAGQIVRIDAAAVHVHGRVPFAVGVRNRFAVAEARTNQKVRFGGAQSIARRSRSDGALIEVGQRGIVHRHRPAQHDVQQVRHVDECVVIAFHQEFDCG